MFCKPKPEVTLCGRRGYKLSIKQINLSKKLVPAVF